MLSATPKQHRSRSGIVYRFGGKKTENVMWRARAGEYGDAARPCNPMLVGRKGSGEGGSSNRRRLARRPRHQQPLPLPCNGRLMTRWAFTVLPLIRVQEARPFLSFSSAIKSFVWCVLSAPVYSSYWLGFSCPMADSSQR
jgi:hypothetical protein